MTPFASSIHAQVLQTVSELANDRVKVVFVSVEENGAVNDTSQMRARCYTAVTFDPASEGGKGGTKGAAAPPQSTLYNIPNVQWDDIGGLAHVRSSILEAIELPLAHPKLFKSANLRRSGILLFGPPGTGKTLVAKAVATECKIPFLSVKGPELLDSYVGGSEANVRAVFADARRAAKEGGGSCVLFFDELDSLAPARDGRGDGGGAMDRVVSMLLAELDECCGGGSTGGGEEEGEADPTSLVTSQVFVIAATNRPDLLDTSLLRPGRLEKLVYLGLTETAEQVGGVLRALCRKFTFEGGLTVEQAVDRVKNEVPVNLSGADLSAVASGAMNRAMSRLISLAEKEAAKKRIPVAKVLDGWSDEDCRCQVACEDLLEAAKEVWPCVEEAERGVYRRLKAQFAS